MRCGKKDHEAGYKVDHATDNMGPEIIAIGGEMERDTHGQGTCLGLALSLSGSLDPGSSETKELWSPWHPIHYKTKA